MSLGPPWSRTPGWWSLDGYPMRVHVPATTSFVSAVAADDKYGPGMWTAMECTVPADRWRIIERVVTADTPLNVLDHAADVLVEKITGWHRWEAEFVWRATLGAWNEVDGDLAGRGVDLLQHDPGRATRIAYAWWRSQLGGDEKAWKKFTKDMRHEPRRVIIREADKPMAAEDQATLQALIAAQ